MCIESIYGVIQLSVLVGLYCNESLIPSFLSLDSYPELRCYSSGGVEARSIESGFAAAYIEPN